MSLPPVSSSVAAPFGGRVLVVDQDEELCRLIADIVGDAGHRARSTRDAEEARDLLAAGEVDLLIVGEALVDVRELGPVRLLCRTFEVPAIVITEFGHSRPFVRAGDEVLTKPFRSGDLLARVARLSRLPQRVAV